MMSQYEQYSIVDATLQPKRTDNLKPGVAAWIGHRTQWQAMGEVEDGPYAGQTRFEIEVGVQLQMRQEGKDLPPFTWVPECDLEIHSLLERIECSDLPETATIYRPDTVGVFKEVMTVEAKLTLTPEAEAAEVTELEQLVKKE